MKLKSRVFSLVSYSICWTLPVQTGSRRVRTHLQILCFVTHVVTDVCYQSAVLDDEQTFSWYCIRYFAIIVQSTHCIPFSNDTDRLQPLKCHDELPDSWERLVLTSWEENTLPITYQGSAPLCLCAFELIKWTDFLNKRIYLFKYHHTVDLQLTLSHLI